MAIALLINAVDRISICKVDSASFTQPVKGQRGTSKFTLQNLSTAAFYTPVIGQSVQWKDGAVVVFRGTIDTFERRPMIETGGGYLYVVTAVSLEQRLDKRFVTRAFAAGTTRGAIVSSILATELADEGIAAGTISAGETLEIGKIYDHARISDVLTELAAECDDFTWYIDPSDGELYFQARTTVPAPFTVDNADVQSSTDPFVSKSRTEYRNRQHVKISETNLVPEVQVFQGNASTSSFTLNKSIRDIVSIRLTTASSSVAIGTFASVPSDGDAIQVGGWQYTFVQTMPPPQNLSYFTQAVNYVLIGRGNFPTLLADTITNLVAALTDNGDGKGSYYSSTSIKNQVVSSATATTTTITVTSNPGTTAGAMALATFTAAFSWGIPTSAEDGMSAFQSFVERGTSDTGAGDFQWIYDVGGTTIEQAPGQTPPASDEQLVVEYKPLGFGIVTVDDVAEQEARTTAEGASGIYENMAIREDILTLDAGIVAATALLTANMEMTERISFDTDFTGLLPGQYAAINDTALNVNASYLIQSVTARIIPAATGHYWRYRVLAVSGTQTTIEGWAALANKGSPNGVGMRGGGSGSKPSPQQQTGSTTPTPAFWEMNFGIESDTVADHATGKYVPVKAEGRLFVGYVTVDELGPEGAADTIIDVKFSDDFGETWTSLFVSGNEFKIHIPAEAGGTDQDIDFAANPRIREITNFADVNLKAGWIARADVLQSGGASNIQIYLAGKPSGTRGQQMNYGSPGIGPLVLLP